MVDRYQPIDQQEPAGTTIFHPDSIPGGRRSRKKNWSGARCSVTCFFSTLGGLSLLLGCVVVYFIILFVRTAHIITPHSPLIWTPPTDNVSYVPADYEVVRPLINSTTPFDLLVTVWLDVTEHLDQGYRLPSPATPLQGQQQEGYKVVEYTLPDGTDMKEAVIYSDLLIRDVLIKDKVHQSVKLRLPIEPFYTQHLGPSTLRATFTLVPKRSVLEAYGTFNNSVSVYPVNAPIRPRRPSYLIHSGRTGTEEGDAEVGDAGGSFMAASNVEEAMDLSSFTASLLQLAPSGKSTKDAGLDLSPNLRLNRLRPSRIFDGDTYNRRFTHKDYPRPGGQGFYYVNPGEDLMVPFINSRSRVMFIKEDRLFQKPSFDHSQYQVRKELASCYPSTNASTWMTCSMDDQDKHVTTQLSFKKEKAEVGSNRGNEEAISPKGEFRHFYAPVLLPGHLASGPRHQLPIPLKRPTASPTDKTAARKASIVIKGGKEIQLCPPTELGVDSNLEFFEMDWDVFFSSHSLFWLAAFQSRDHAVPTLWEEEWEEDLKEGKGYLPTKTRMDHEKEWMLQAHLSGDREHPNSRPWLGIVSFLVVELCNLAQRILELIYWYTRTTTIGISFKAQYFAIAWHIIILFGILNNKDFASGGIFSKIFSILRVSIRFASVPLAILTLLRIEIERPRDGSWKLWRWMILRKRPTKKERNSLEYDKAIRWSLIAVIFSLSFVVIQQLEPWTIELTKPQGCNEPFGLLEDSKYYFDIKFDNHLRHATSITASIVQVLMNQSHPRSGFLKSKPGTDRQGRGIFAGTFKLVIILSNIQFWVPMLIHHVEFIGGWRPRRYGMTLFDVGMATLLSIGLYQAVTLPGVPQQRMGDEDEDEDER